jgi:hypothetical protein
VESSEAILADYAAAEVTIGNPSGALPGVG